MKWWMRFFGPGIGARGATATEWCRSLAWKNDTSIFTPGAGSR
ncbi:hypothetical protein Y695_04458 [Hydrogenophaga sp. T4]|nr:hypothetical protein Y695_04458 [Hydrogenophaga sp. T4]